MYSYAKQSIGGFHVYKATPEVGAIHCKKFASAVTPQNQATLNVYIAGSFELSAGSFTQALEAGQTSLDVTLAEYPAGELFTERVLSGPAIRYCVSKAGGGTWLRARIEITETWVPEYSGLLIYFDGDLLETTKGVSPTKIGLAVYCWAGS
jgi:hypothetical protein